MTPWIFFDVGGVLFVDLAQSYHAYRRHYEALVEVRPTLTFAELLAERERRIAAGRMWVLFEIAREWLGDARAADVAADTRQWLIERFDHHHHAPPGLEPLLDDLASQYRLGIIANQPAACRPSLDRRGLLQRFDVVALSEEINLYKPDPAIFRWALERRGIGSAPAVMVGDRLDNDIAPARLAGMRTIWLDAPPITPGSAAQRAAGLPDDAMASAFLESIARQPLFTGRREPVPASPDHPDCTIADLGELRHHLPTIFAD